MTGLRRPISTLCRAELSCTQPLEGGLPSKRVYRTTVTALPLWRTKGATLTTYPIKLDTSLVVPSEGKCTRTPALRNPSKTANSVETGIEAVVPAQAAPP